MTLSERIPVIRNVGIINLSDVDLSRDDIGVHLGQMLERQNLQNVVIDLSDVYGLSNVEINRLIACTQVLNLQGCQSVVCGFAPETAASIFSLRDDIPFNVSRDTETAIDEIYNLQRL